MRGRGAARRLVRRRKRCSRIERTRKLAHVERNLTRLTILVAVLFFANTIVLFRLLQ